MLVGWLVGWSNTLLVGCWHLDWQCQAHTLPDSWPVGCRCHGRALRGCLAGWAGLVGWLWLVEWLVGRLVDWLDWLPGGRLGWWLAAWLASWLACC